MATERECERCNGRQFQLTTETGIVISWRDRAGNPHIWFCPKCDWGDTCEDEQ